MGKIWLKSVDPSKQCCGCEGKSGPCASCCGSLEAGSWKSLYSEGEFKDKIVKIGDLSGEVSFDESSKLLKIINENPDFEISNQFAYYDYKFLLSLNKGEIVELHGEILPPSKISNFISNTPIGQSPPANSQLVYEKTSESRILIQGDYVLDEKLNAFVSYEIEGEAIEDVSYDNKLELPEYAQRVLEGTASTGFIDLGEINVRDSALYINILKSQNNNSPFFTQTSPGSNVNRLWYFAGSNSSVRTNYGGNFSLDFRSSAVESATTYSAFWDDYFTIGPNFYNIGYIPPIFPSFIDEGLQKVAKIKVTSIKKILYEKANIGNVISQNEVGSACVNVLCNKNFGLRILSPSLSPINIKSRLRKFTFAQ